ncbi:MAG: Hsp20/alpha crystallin family protein [Anaerolineales bacterium]|nr:Hsp20/alpha crystallin family protein [Anaerolineales bacterium]
MSDQEKSLEVQKEEVALEEGAEWARDRRVFLPRSDIYEASDHIMAVVDIPGAKEEDIHVTLEKNVLTINAYVEADPMEGYSLAYAEYEVGDYQRSFRLPDEIDRDKIEATYRDGVLRLRLPKAEGAKMRKIAIHTD